MSIQVMSWVWERSPQKGEHLLLLLAIADFCDDHGKNAWPSKTVLGERCRLTEDQVKRGLRHLKECGELAVDYGSGPGRGNAYRITFDTAPSSQGVSRWEFTGRRG